MKTKLLVIGPSSPHLNTFIGLVFNLFDEIVYVGEQHLETDFSIRQHIVNFRSLNLFSLRSAKKKLEKIIEGENPNLVHIQQVNRVAYLASGILKKHKRKFVLTAWGSDVLLIPNQNFLYKKMIVSTLKRADVVTADSLHMLSEIRKLVPFHKKIELVLFGIDPIHSLPKEKIIFSNRALESLYRIDLILDYFETFFMVNKEWQLIIAGKGSEEENLKKKLTTLDCRSNVLFVGWLTAEENRNYYQKSSVYISVPLSDGTSVSLLEAMSAGCIPVVSDLPVAHEWIENGANGIIVNKNDNALMKAIELDFEKVKEVNGKIISSRATKDIANKNLASIYQSISHV